MADGGYLGAGGRLAGGPADELVEAAYAHELRAAPRLAYDLSLSDIAHAVALAESGALPAETARVLLRRPARAARHPGRRVPLAGRARRRVQLARGRARAAHRQRRRRLAERRPAAPRGVPRRAARLLAPRRRRARRARWPTRRARWRCTPARCATRSPPTTPTCRRPSRRPPATCCWPTPIPRCATPSACGTPTASSPAASPARAAAPARAGRSIARGWPSCSAATGLVAAREGRGLAVGRLRRAARDARDRGHAPLPARAGLRDLREPRVRADRAGRPSTRARAR